MAIFNSYVELPGGVSISLLKTDIESSWVYPLKMVAFHSYVNVYKRVMIFAELCMVILMGKYGCIILV